MIDPLRIVNLPPSNFGTFSMRDDGNGIVGKTDGITDIDRRCWHARFSNLNSGWSQGGTMIKFIP